MPPPASLVLMSSTASITSRKTEYDAIGNNYRNIDWHWTSDSGRSCIAGLARLATMRNLEKRSFFERALKEARVQNGVEIEQLDLLESSLDPSSG